jgi:hypothetical protein
MSYNLGRIIVPPQPKLVNYGQRAFARATSRLWNDLPVSIRLAPNFTFFKCLLKTDLYVAAYL